MRTDCEKTSEVIVEAFRRYLHDEIKGQKGMSIDKPPLVLYNIDNCDVPPRKGDDECM